MVERQNAEVRADTLDVLTEPGFVFVKQIESAKQDRGLDPVFFEFGLFGGDLGLGHQIHHRGVFQNQQGFVRHAVGFDRRDDRLFEIIGLDLGADIGQRLLEGVESLILALSLVGLITLQIGHKFAKGGA